MPELPEVETIRCDLDKIIVGKKITEVCVHNPKVIREPGVSVFKNTLKGQTIEKVLRRAKLLIVKLSNGQYLTIHLKMTGQLVYPGGKENSRVAFYLSNGKVLDFNDQRLFAELRLIDDWQKLDFVKKLGPEPQDLTLNQFKEMLGRKKTKIKPLLMDQTFISGIGNLYAAEILFSASINPQRPADSLKDSEKDLLFKKINDILKSAIRYGGSSIDDYVRLSGNKGEYKRFHKVYGREGLACYICKTKIRRISQGGRGTYFCPHCQK